MICKLQRPGRLNLTSLVPNMSAVARHPDLHHINRVKTPLLLDPSAAELIKFHKVCGRCTRKTFCLYFKSLSGKHCKDLFVILLSPLEK